MENLLKESVYTRGSVTVGYRLRPQSGDRRHLVVVFAGVSKGKHDFYGFDGHALDHVKGAVLWIKDSFEENNAYYMCRGLHFDIEQAVAALIDSTLSDLGLTHDQCTLMGGSKGGSAALLFGLKYPYRNIVASVPQTQIGTYTRQKLAPTFDYMAGENCDHSEILLNDYLPSWISSPSHHAKNIYIISSRSDPEFSVHIEPHLDQLRQFENFNLLLTNSPLVTAHPEVTPYNIPFILSTLYSLCDNLFPRFGMVSNGAANSEPAMSNLSVDQAGKSNPEQVGAFHWVQLKKSRIVFAGYAVSRGVSVTATPMVPPSIKFDNGNSVFTTELRPVVDKTLNAKLYTDRFVEYRGAGVVPSDSQGIDLSVLPEGEYTVQFVFHNSRGENEADISARKELSLSDSFDGFHYILSVDAKCARLQKQSLRAHVAGDTRFHFSKLDSEDNILFVSGEFIIPREWMRAWNDGAFMLTLEGDNGSTTFPLGATRLKSTTRGEFAESDYSWSGFTTVGHAGIDLGHLEHGEYDGYVTFIRQGRVYASTISFQLKIANDCQVIGTCSSPTRSTEI